MTSAEVLNLFESKSNKAIEYGELRRVMTKLGITLKPRIYDGVILTSYLDRSDIHDLAKAFGVDLYNIRFSNVCPLLPNRAKWVTLHN